MRTFSRFTAVATLALAGMTLTACTTYYQVTDPTTGQSYYTTDYKTKGSGAVVFTSLHTGDEITLQNSQITQVNENQAKYGTPPAAKKTAPATPAGHTTNTTTTAPATPPATTGSN